MSSSPEGVHEDSPSAIRRYAVPAAAGLSALCVIAAVIFVFLGDGTPPPRPVQELTIVKIIPPPPPPPPPPQEVPPPPAEPEMIEQPKMAEPEIKEEAPAEEPKEAPPDDSSEPPPMGPLGLDQAPEGPGDQFNLAGNPGGRGFTGGGGGGGSRWGWYCTIIQKQIEESMRANAKTRSVPMQLEVRIWADSSGRVNRVLIVTPTGDTVIDAAMRDEVLSGLVLKEPPPHDMPMPIVTRVTARRAT
jgi:periplasmic protein TonB